MKARFFKFVLPPVISLIALLIVGELVVGLTGVKPYLVPAPHDIAQAVWVHRLELLAGAMVTAKATLAGFAGAAALGFAIAVALSTHRLIERAFYPYAVLFQTVPIIAIAPLLVIWAGPGFNAVAISALIVSIFPVIANTLAGLLSTDPALRDLFRLYGGGPVATLVKLKIPSALPNIVTGLRIGSGLAVIGAIVGEFVAGQVGDNRGLGLIVLVSLTQFNNQKVFATVLTASLLGIALFLCVHLAGSLLLRRWHASEMG